MVLEEPKGTILMSVHKVWHKGLIAKLQQIGVSGQPLKLFESYLSNRRQRVVIEGVYSKEEPVTFTFYNIHQ